MYATYVLEEYSLLPWCPTPPFPFSFPTDGHQAPKGNNILTLTKGPTQDLKSFNAGSPVSEKTCFTQFMKLDNTPTCKQR